MSRHRLCLVHPLDPRTAPTDVVSARIGAILARRPDDFTLLVVGVDDRGDLEPGVVVELEAAGRVYDFMPVARGRDARRFGAGILRRLSRIRAAARAPLSSVAVHAFGWAALARLVGRPLVLVVHRDPRRGVVAGRVSAFAALRERLGLAAADRIVACDGDFVRRCRRDDPVAAAKIEQLTLITAVDDDDLVDDPQIGRLWERHRRFHDVRAVHHGAASVA